MEIDNHSLSLIGNYVIILYYFKLSGSYLNINYKQSNIKIKKYKNKQ